MPAIRSFTVLPVLPDPIKDLKFVAENIYWSWNSSQGTVRWDRIGMDVL